MLVALRARLAQLARPRVIESLPVLLDRRRVYVVPTRFGLFFSALLLAMLLGALNYNNNPALLLAMLLAASGLASLIFAHLQLSGLRVDALSAEPVAAGEALHLRLGISTRDRRMRRGLQVQLDSAASALPQLEDAATVTLQLPTQRRGWLVLDRIRLSSTQPLGLAFAWSWVWPDSALLVYPTPETPSPSLPENGARRNARLDPSGEEMHHLREYRSGDAQRAIAWKASARRDSLVVREHQQLRGEVLELAWRELRSLNHEQKISRLAAWVDAAERAQRPYRLHIPHQAPLGPALGHAHRHDCLRALALMPEGVEA